MQNSTQEITLLSIFENADSIPPFESGNPQFASYTASNTILNNPIVIEHFQNILTSIVYAVKTNDKLIVDVATLVNNDTNIDNFELKYAKTLNALGAPQISIFILLNTKNALTETTVPKDIANNYFEIAFLEKTYDLSTIETIEVFVLHNNNGFIDCGRAVVADIKLMTT